MFCLYGLSYVLSETIILSVYTVFAMGASYTVEVLCKHILQDLMAQSVQIVDAMKDVLAQACGILQR